MLTCKARVLLYYPVPNDDVVRVVNDNSGGGVKGVVGIGYRQWSITCSRSTTMKPSCELDKLQVTR